MLASRAYFCLKAFLVMVMLFSQSVSLAHATSYGDTPHDHDEQICFIGAVMQDEQGDVLSKPVLPVRVNFAYTPVYSMAYGQITVSLPQGRAPPPRGPPSLIQIA